jgi:hypothetical protein
MRTFSFVYPRAPLRRFAMALEFFLRWQNGTGADEMMLVHVRDTWDWNSAMRVRCGVQRWYGT